MSRSNGLDRRAFLRRAGATAVIGAVGAKDALAFEPSDASSAGARQEYNFDEIYDRVGTDCTKWDGAIASFGEDIEVGGTIPRSRQNRTSLFTLASDPLCIGC